MITPATNGDEDHDDGRNCGQADASDARTFADDLGHRAFDQEEVQNTPASAMAVMITAISQGTKIDALAATAVRSSDFQ